MDDTGFFSVQVGLGCYFQLKSYDCKLFLSRRVFVYVLVQQNY
jgi:hypothetical protein